MTRTFRTGSVLIQWPKSSHTMFGWQKRTEHEKRTLGVEGNYSYVFLPTEGTFLVLGPSTKTGMTELLHGNSIYHVDIMEVGNFFTEVTTQLVNDPRFYL